MSKEAIELQKEVVKFLNTISELMFSNDFAVVRDLKVARRRAKAVLALLEKKPEVAEFTKRFRDFIRLSKEHSSKSKIGRLRTYGKEACDVIDRQEEKIKQLDWEIEGLKAIIQNTEGEIVLPDQESEAKDD
ncbi:hypothetical protein LCGC14_0400230 [marine sediment metagenome]|uniref:Uncharacterized protein n=1 Tax=marine sediment metagenome TaxID=412755 RepID=A0A0F9W604_9ZZZZ